MEEEEDMEEKEEEEEEEERFSSSKAHGVMQILCPAFSLPLTRQTVSKRTR